MRNLKEHIVKPIETMYAGLVMCLMSLTPGKTGDVGKGALLVVTGAVSLFIGLFVVSEIDRAITRNNFTAAMNTTYTGIRTSTMTAFTLIGIGLIVMGAALILSYIREGF